MSLPSTSAILPLKSTAKSENTHNATSSTSVPATHTPAENDVPATDSVSLLFFSLHVDDFNTFRPVGGNVHCNFFC